jgi:RNA polymerase sigma-70 factor (ECF subfamily)
MKITSSDKGLDFEELFKTHYKFLCNAANKILDDRDAAEDVVQEVFLKYWNKREELTAIQSLKSYLYRAAVNTALNKLESNKRTSRLEESEAGQTFIMDDRIHLNQLESRINDAINRLPPKCRAIFVLSRYEGMKYQQIADHLDISVKTVENQMGKALQIMRDKLKTYLSKDIINVGVITGLIALSGLLGGYLPVILVFMCLRSL